ncbi:hypothetical protein EB061_11630 [bacterium]|nr:hypothetical protein [bacterium]
MSEQGRFPTAKNLQVDELLKLYDGVMEDVDAALADANISSQVSVPTSPDGLEELVLYGPHGDPFPPEDLTEVDSVILGKLFTFYSALKIHYKDRGTATAVLDDYINTDERYAVCERDLVKIQAYFWTCESRYEQLKRSLNNVSREQTRRGEELEREIYSERGGKPIGGKGSKVPQGGFRR